MSRAAQHSIGLIVNPSAGKSSGKGLALAGKLEGDTNVAVRVLDSFARLPASLDDLAKLGVTTLFISSGDGTIQAILTELAERRAFAKLPRIGLLPHGTTNMTAADLGFKKRGLEALAAIIRDPQAGDLRQRQTLRVANPRDGRARHGMFLGAGAVSHATLYCQQVFNAKGVKGSFATFATLASAAGRAILTPADPADPTRIDRPHEIVIDIDGRRMVNGRQLFMVTSTLERLALGTRPFWGGKTAPLRTSVFPYPVPSVVRWLLPAMYGGEDRKMPEGAVSFCSDSMSIGTASTLVLDGEFFEPPEGKTLRIETGPLFTFLRG